jgi:hypothetical protein
MEAFRKKLYITMEAFRKKLYITMEAFYGSLEVKKPRDHRT